MNENILMFHSPEMIKLYKKDIKYYDKKNQENEIYQRQIKMQ